MKIQHLRCEIRSRLVRRTRVHKTLPNGLEQAIRFIS